MLVVFTEVKPVEGKGLGLFAAEAIGQNMQVWLRSTKFDRLLSKQEVEAMPIHLPERIFIEKYGCQEPDGSLYVSIDNARFMNHSDKPNTRASKSDGLVLLMITTRAIQVGEEITCNYRDICEACKFDLGFIPK